MDILIMVSQLVLSLAILIVLHEAGHFIPAKLFKTRVEKFYLFFDPWFSLFRFKKGDTEYGIGWLPLGGYVKISGMIDESMDKEQMKQPPKPWEFRSKPAWQRLVIMLGGVFVNFILGFFIFAMILWSYGETYLPAENVTAGIHADSIGQEIGLETGDHILYIGDVPFERFAPQNLIREVVVNQARTITVERDGREVQIPIEDHYARMMASHDFRNHRVFTARFPFKVFQVAPDTPAEEAGLKPGDQVLNMEGISIHYFDEFQRYAREFAGEKVTIDIRRGDGSIASMEVQLTEQGTIGVFPYGADHFYETATREFGFLESLPAGYRQGMTFLTDQLKAFGQMFTGDLKASESLGGFGTITSLFPTQWHWADFWRVTAVLSLILGFMNLLPIPALDGGHVMFLLWEVITGKKPSDKFMEYATIIGFIIVISIVLYANGLDVVRWLG
ncbi:MAG: RIP metalloprotease RseP [Saprospirales bacterium]|nr:MAG: RIP metalloprotease RseP [Saprospirales bacterium]